MITLNLLLSWWLSIDLLHLFLVLAHSAYCMTYRICGGALCEFSIFLYQWGNHLNIVLRRCLGVTLTNLLSYSRLFWSVAISKASRFVSVLLHMVLLTFIVSICLQYLLTAWDHNGVDVIRVLFKAQFLMWVVKGFLPSVSDIFGLRSRVVSFFWEGWWVCQVFLLRTCTFILF